MKTSYGWEAAALSAALSVAPPVGAGAVLSMEHFMLWKIGASLSAIPADIDNGSEWQSLEQEAYFSIENTGPMTSSSVSSDEEG